jgi:uncharacterized damage-inducible protein DinB
MKGKLLLFITLAVILLGINFTFAQDKKAEANVVKGVRDESISLINLAESRYVALAEAIPQEKYAWRPGEGVRSVGEVFTHMVQANYGLPNVIGIKTPADAPKNVTAVTDKKEIIALLKKSFEYSRNVVKGLSDADLEKDVKFFGNDTTYRGVSSWTRIC